MSREQGRSKKLPENFDDLLAEAIQLKKEVPKRSVEQLILILELEGRVAPGVLKRSTLQRHLYKAGFGVRQMQMYNDARQSSAKRFCKPHRMMLIQGDIKYGPKLPIGKNGKMVQTYLSSAIDDHSRYVLSSVFYDNQEEAIVLDTFRKSILKFGKFDACYFDNGAQYVAKQLKLSLARLGITIRHAKVRSGKSKGKVEKFHQVVDAYLREAKIHQIRTLKDLNHHWSNFLEEHYHKRQHGGIREYYQSLGVRIPEEGISPLQEWHRDSRALTYIDTAVVAEAFLHHETRQVDKGGCISFRGQKYETKASLIGFEVEIAYDPMTPEILTVHHPATADFQARPVRIGDFCDKEPTLPVSIQEVESSRLLVALSKKRNENRLHVANAISFKGFKKGGDDHV
jgi:transposase InsO family protein